MLTRVALAWRAKILAARLRRRRAGPQPDREEVVRRHAAGHSFLDVGCMWSVNGRIALVAEEAGAEPVTGLDVIEATPEFEAERARRGSAVRFVRGDLNDPAVVEEAGPHQVVWCSGVLYHAPNPVLTLERLRALTTETLILQTMTVPELPGVAQGLVFYPGLPERQKALYDRWGAVARSCLSDPDEHEDRYSPWWWGISPSALRAMLRTAGFEIEREWGDPFGRHVVARPV
jgi:hypothetical protein